MRSALQFVIHGKNIVDIEAQAEQTIQRFLAVDSGTDVSELADIEIHATDAPLTAQTIAPGARFQATVNVRIK